MRGKGAVALNPVPFKASLIKNGLHDFGENLQ
jgi:hypothetical protein